MIFNMSESTFGGDEKTVLPKDVNFYDYDGMIVDSYTAAEFASLSSLPVNPSHDGLIAQGWNWSLPDAKTYVETYGSLSIGQNYTTDDGNTRIYISLEDGRLSPTIGIAVNGTATIDWGDGTTDTITGTNLTTVINTQHTYASAGQYTITLSTSGTIGIVGSNTYGSELLWKNSTVANENIVYQGAIRKVELGSQIRSIGTSAFNNCKLLESINIPTTLVTSGTTSLGGRAFYICESLKALIVPSNVIALNNGAVYACRNMAVLSVPKDMNNLGTSTINTSGVVNFEVPQSVTSIGSSMFYGCVHMRKIVMPSGITSILNDAFNGCNNLSTIEIPATVQSIGTNAFANCVGIKEYHFRATTPPTLAGTNAFTNIPSDSVIYVPSESLPAYQAASNWSTYASKMIGV